MMGFMVDSLDSWKTDTLPMLPMQKKYKQYLFSLFVSELRNGTGAIGMKNIEVEGHLPMQSTIQHITDYSKR